MNDPGIPNFEARNIRTGFGNVFVQMAGSGPPVLLLHGFPETSLMWHSVAPILGNDFTIIAADLPGYGRSDCPPDLPEHESMSKRHMAKTLISVMQQLGFDSFAVIGHDRGGRVAYRAALDHPSIVTKLAVLDVVPTADVWDQADSRLALAFWPFSLLAQPFPLPERLIAADPDAIVENALSQWGTPDETFPEWLRSAYVAALKDKKHIHTICEEYRAAAGIDRDNDNTDRADGTKIFCPVFALWSEAGGLEHWYQDVGGPLAIWRRWAENVEGHAVAGGHFFPEEHPDKIAQLLVRFLKQA